MDKTTRRRPINIEFTGTPEAGKTTQLAIISKWLREEGLNVTTIRETAEIVPTLFKKGSIEANRWMRLKATEELICANETDTDVVIIDRGIIDGIIWNEIFFYQKKISQVEKESYQTWQEQFMLYPDLLFAFYLSPELSIKRRGGEGRITTNSFVSYYNSAVMKFLNSYSGRYLEVDASLSLKEVTQMLQSSIRSILPY